MSNHRLERIAQQIQQELSRLFLSEVKDARLGAVSVTGTRISPDLQQAHIHYVIIGADSARDRAEVAASLERANGFLRSALAKRLRLRRVPVLHFHQDDSLERATHIETVLDDLRERGELGGDDSDPGDD